MKNLKRLLALIGVILLAGMYVLTLILSLTDNSAAGNVLMASLFGTVIIPVLLYAFLLVYKWTRPKDEVLSKILAETSEINTLIFDIGKVLVDYDWKKLLQDLKYDEETSQSVAKAVFLSDTWTEGDRGVLSEEELLQAFISNNPVYEKEIRETFQRMGETIHVYSYTKSWLKYLKKQGYKLYILSNFSQPLYDRCQKEMKFLGFMDGGYMSWQIHCLKPEPEIYQKLIKDFQIEPSKAVFIDDRLDNVAEARAQGLHAVHFTGRKNAMGQLADFGVK
ncbi:MAG TPA: HAD family phosphatase [Candidatus Blautia merdipullorum]|nr:HAD family phosphatase [Candidatus Blautia merdipullorum]